MSCCQWCGLPVEAGKYHEREDCKEALRNGCYHYRVLEEEVVSLRNELGVLRGQLSQKGIVRCWRQIHWLGQCEGVPDVCGGNS